ncbi:Twitching motility protein PilT [Anaerovibrio sp. JC8]|uniref:type IV pilus twitching motility protein PilT n=1 Tax=Anaerovibrio sp. JC8 TaxID=1240085 RepID=UPI000A0AE11D|nr:ATPase, T2SS/T4P/T4SS family [Anaerovibrio sp. JC8]ORT99576.1 Twitching motility protein PilT [Anaerovibrio sp. JC8]
MGAFEKEFERILISSSQEGISDVFITEGAPVFCRRAGLMFRLGDYEITRDDIWSVFTRITRREHQEDFLKRKEADFTWELSEWRYRVHIYRQRGRTAFAFRVLPKEIPPLERLGQAGAVEQFMDYEDGLLLITGATGAGKTTTVASFLAEMSTRKDYHILTLEDPVEFVFPQGRCLFSQQELGRDFLGYPGGIISAMRENPNVIMIAELRDGESCEAALSAAASGHFVIATMHTGGVVETVERFISMFYEERQNLARSMLASSLRGICAQKLFAGQRGRQYCGVEVLHGNNAAANIIRRGKYEQLQSVMQSGGDQGMQTMEMAVERLRGEQLRAMDRAI